MSEKLKPCPFCGGEAKKATVFGRRGVSCTACVGGIRSEIVCDEGDTIYEHWNNRPIEDKLTSEIERLKVTLLQNIGTFEDLDKALKTAEDALEVCKKRPWRSVTPPEIDEALSEIRAAKGED